jgi:hypothetical protein
MFQSWVWRVFLWSSDMRWAEGSWREWKRLVLNVEANKDGDGWKEKFRFLCRAVELRANGCACRFQARRDLSCLFLITAMSPLTSSPSPPPPCHPHFPMTELSQLLHPPWARLAIGQSAEAHGMLARFHLVFQQCFLRIGVTHGSVTVPAW